MVIDRTADPRHLRAAALRAATKASCRSSSWLEHLATRLVRGWTHLERQKGGGIGLRGRARSSFRDGRRLLGNRVKMLKSRLAQSRRRQVRRRARDGATFCLSSGRLHQCLEQVDAVQAR